MNINSLFSYSSTKLEVSSFKCIESALVGSSNAPWFGETLIIFQEVFVWSHMTTCTRVNNDNSSCTVLDECYQLIRFSITGALSGCIHFFFPFLLPKPGSSFLFLTLAFLSTSLAQQFSIGCPFRLQLVHIGVFFDVVPMTPCSS